MNENKQGLTDAVTEALKMLDEIPLEEWNTKSGKHGRVVDYRMEAYQDVVVYEDGTEERFDIGD